MSWQKTNNKKAKIKSNAGFLPRLPAFARRKAVERKKSPHKCFLTFDGFF
jgi:hypothetical protein